MDDERLLDRDPRAGWCRPAVNAGLSKSVGGEAHVQTRESSRRSRRPRSRLIETIWYCRRILIKNHMTIGASLSAFVARFAKLSTKIDRRRVRCAVLSSKIHPVTQQSLCRMLLLATCGSVSSVIIAPIATAAAARVASWRGSWSRIRVRVSCIWIVTSGWWRRAPSIVRIRLVPPRRWRRKVSRRRTSAIPSVIIIIHWWSSARRSLTVCSWTVTSWRWRSATVIVFVVAATWRTSLTVASSIWSLVLDLRVVSEGTYRRCERLTSGVQWTVAPLNSRPSSFSTADLRSALVSNSTKLSTVS